MSEPTGIVTPVGRRGTAEPRDLDLSGHPEHLVGAPVPIGRHGPSPSWQIAARVSAKTLDPGQQISIEVYFSGEGPVDSAKLFFRVPEALDCSNHGFASIAWREERTVQEPNSPELGSRYAKFARADTRIEGSTGMLLDLTPGFSLPPPRTIPPFEHIGSATLAAGEFRVETEKRQPNKNEPDFFSHPPVWLRWILPRGVPPGDHEIPFVLTYSKGKDIQTASYTLSVHIRPFWERAWFQALVVGSFVLAVAAAILGVISWLGFKP